jgi:diphthamide synthase subunit DPH2
MMSLSLVVLTSGCAQIVSDSYCDVASPIFMKGEETISLLMNKDRDLLVDLIVHNETLERICGEIE